jgi:hypothetical protein
LVFSIFFLLHSAFSARQSILLGILILELGKKEKQCCSGWKVEIGYE